MGERLKRRRKKTNESWNSILKPIMVPVHVVPGAASSMWDPVLDLND